ncbi:PPR domain-containing protein/PPR_2 domain-containing protein [Cephalotus follicularis]|uniref:PPR domain-containing protein/PPR_2 domain-containing protein n=1 Tax=Cephalotus follicularis TaxID=3775 RepID=A0A1Q3B8J8_CEPFO|nr:PPR domain-containing protein/PPR_2 domain-containing protein [Cephalotus follicularis]GAV92122.1 PPR domain-containing protein/PPR_2 domain-containing protein [Cephalotus follicularis]
MRPATELATRISRALISASSNSRPTKTWAPSLEQDLHQLGLRDSLSPSLVSRVIDPFLLTHHSLALGFFNWASQQPNFTHSSLSYQSILKSLSLSRQYNAMDSLLKKVKTQNITLSSATYRFVIRSFIQGRKTHNAFLLFNDVKEPIEDIGADICNCLLAALASDGFFDNAQKVFDEMSRRCFCFSTIGFGVFIWRFCKSGEIDKALCMLDEVNKGSSEINGSVIALLIVHGLCEGSRVKEASWVLDELRSRRCKPDFMTYRIVAEAFRSAGSVVDRERILKKKRKLGVAPRSKDYREFILDLIAQRRISEAKDLAEVIVTGDFPIEDDVLNALIGSVSAIDPIYAIMFFNFMVGKGRLPTRLTLINMSRNLCKHGKNDELLEVYRVLNSNDFFCDTETYNVMVSFLCKAGKVREAYGVLQEMKKKGFVVDVSFYNSLMEACCREDLLRPAKRLWDEMFASGCSGNLKTYNILIMKFSEIGQVEEAERLFHHMLEKRVVPDATTYISLLEGLCQEDKSEVAFEVFNKSLEQDVMLAQSILSTFVLCLCRKGHFLVASKLLCGLSYDIGHADTHSTLLKFLADANELQVAIEHIKLVQETLPSLVQVISNELLESLPSLSKPDPILQLLQAIRDNCPNSNCDAWKDLCKRS